MTSTASYQYDLPAERIAQEPCEPRDQARLLVDRGPGLPPLHKHVAELPELVRPGDLLVVNETRVMPARLQLQKPTGGAVEVLLLDRSEQGEWQALVKPSRRVKPGTVLHDGELGVVIGEDLGGGRRSIRLCGAASDEQERALVAAHGRVPLPPYIRRPLANDERYQTVFAKERGDSAAAPTAGLHLTEAVLAQCCAAGARIRAVDLQVGLGTFRPITSQHIEDHVMHGERYAVPGDVMDACEHADRVIAIGTTVVRALESAAFSGQLEGDTHLFIHGDFKFRAVDVLMTNFHVPGSSLLVMVEAFVGPRWRELYGAALAEDYRFLSFGDAMWLPRRAAE